MFRRNRKFYLPKFVRRPGTTVNTVALWCVFTYTRAGNVYAVTAVTYTLRSFENQCVTPKSARCRQNRQTNIYGCCIVH